MENFTIALALLDAVPVLLFCVSMMLVVIRFQSLLFLVGSMLCIFAGLGKVAWKLLLAMKQKDVSLLNRSFRYLMSSGGMLLLGSLLVDGHKVDWSMLLACMISFPVNVCFIVAGLGMCLMMVCAKRLSQKNATVNWIEEGINCLIQTCILVGIMCIK